MTRILKLFGLVLLKLLVVVLIVAGGIVTAYFCSRFCIGYSDAEMQTIGRISYYGLPIPFGHNPCNGFWGDAFLSLFNIILNSFLWIIIFALLICILRRMHGLRRIFWIVILLIVVLTPAVVRVCRCDKFGKGEAPVISDPRIIELRKQREEERRERERERDFQFQRLQLILKSLSI